MNIERRLKRTQWALLLLSAFLLLLGLGSMRLYAVYLEHRLSEMTRLVDEAQERQLLLRQELASLLSPARVYSYAHAELGMGYATRIVVCKVQTGGASDLFREETRPISLWERFARIVGREASAKD